jgi:polyisoprenoid-binding protein YceI
MWSSTTTTRLAGGAALSERQRAKHASPLSVQRMTAYVLTLRFSMSGRFDKITGTIEFDPVQHNGHADITVSIDSVSTGVPMLDQFLRSAKFFDASRFPTATFQSKSFRFSGEQLVSVNGDLSLHGITKPVELDVVYFSCRQHPLLNVPACGADARVTIKRSEFGFDAFTGNDSDEVEIDIAVEALEAQRP